MQALTSDISRVVVASRPRTLVLVVAPDDIEGVLLGPAGGQIGWPARVPRTGDPATAFTDLWPQLEPMGDFDRVTVLTKAGLGAGWELDVLAREVERQCGHRVRARAFDELRWSHLIQRSGVELVLAVGDELESALFSNGVLVPGLVLGRHRFRKGRTYSEYLSTRVRERKGEKAWTRRLERVITEVLAVWNPTRLYVAVPPEIQELHVEESRVAIIDAPSALERALTLWT